MTENKPETRAEETLRYHIEKTEKRGTDVWIRGWYVSTAGGTSFSVLGDGGRPIEGTTVNYQRRMDLQEAFHVELSCCFGFEAVFPRRAVHGRKAVLSFKNEYTSMEYSMDLCAFDLRNTRAGKLWQLLTPEKKEQNKRILREQGIRYFCGYLTEQSLPYGWHYDFYQRNTAAKRGALKKFSRMNLSPAPLFSVIAPVDRWDGGLERLVSSLKAQTYGNWELVLIGKGVESAPVTGLLRDRRIRWLVSPGRTVMDRIADGLKKTAGEYIILSYPDCFFTPDMLYRHIEVLHPHPQTVVIYGDTDHLTKSGRYVEPMYKPEFDPDYLCSHDYIGLPLMISREALFRLVKEPEGGVSSATREEVTGRMAFTLLACELLLKISEEEGCEIRHIPRVICHLRRERRKVRKTIPGAESKDPRAAIIRRHYDRLGVKAEVLESGYPGVLRSRYAIPGEPLVSILIPNKDHAEDLRKCIDSITGISTWKNLEIIIIENNSTEQATEEYYREACSDPRVRVVRFSGGFNYSAINNLGSAAAKGDYLILLNNDTEVITPDWIEQLMGYCGREGTGIAGARLLYPDDTIQHAGVVAGIGGIAGHLDLGRDKYFAGPLMRTVSARRSAAVTGACMMVKASLYKKLGGLDPEFAVALNDVDLCLRALYEGEGTVYVPGAELYHYESKSRGLETTPEKAARFASESALFQRRHKEFLEEGDPWYNPNLTRSGTDGSEKTIFGGSEEANR